MNKNFSNFSGSIPEDYDTGLVPYIFDDYARDLVNRILGLDPKNILEIAAGTGVVTQKLHKLLDNNSRLTVTDLNQAMLDIAQGKTGDADNLVYKQADASELPFDDNVYDLVFNQFGIMFVPDKDAAYRETLRVLLPGGTFMFNVWDSFDINYYIKLSFETIASFFDSDPPQFLKVPFGYYNIDEITDALHSAGFEGINHEVLAIKKEVDDVNRFARGIVCGNPTVEEIRSSGCAPEQDVISAVSQTLVKEFGDKMVIPLQTILFTATKPA